MKLTFLNVALFVLSFTIDPTNSIYVEVNHKCEGMEHYIAIHETIKVVLGTHVTHPLPYPIA